MSAKAVDGFAFNHGLWRKDGSISYAWQLLCPHTWNVMCEIPIATFEGVVGFKFFFFGGGAVFAWPQSLSSMNLGIAQPILA